MEDPPFSLSVWSSSEQIVEALEGVSNGDEEDAKNKILALLYPSDNPMPLGGDAMAQDLEMAVHSAILDRFDKDDDASIEEALSMLSVCYSVVTEILHRAESSNESMPMEKCKTWWNLLVNVSEDASRSVPVRFIAKLLENWELTLPQLKDAYLKKANRSVEQHDAQVELDREKQKQKEIAAEKERKEKESEKDSKEKDKDGKEKDGGGKDGKDKDAKDKDAKDAKEKDAKEKEAKEKEAKEKEAKDAALEIKRAGDRCKLFAQLGIAPNGVLYLTLTSLLKQLHSRLCSSLHAEVRARIVLLLEHLLASDHKAIANNQKMRWTEYVEEKEMDSESTWAAACSSTAEAPASTDASAGEAKDKGKGMMSLATDPEVNYEFYRSFWGLQDAFQNPDKLLDKKDNWESFSKALSKVLKLFTKYPKKVDSARLLPWTSPEPIPMRSAPRAAALAVELDNPGVRHQFLIQALIALQSLEHDVNNKKGETGGLIHKQGEPMKKDFSSLKKSCEAALNNARHGFKDRLECVLEREAHWVQWKALGCREFLHPSVEMTNPNHKVQRVDVLPANPEPKSSSKPQLEKHVNLMLRTLKDPQFKVLPNMKGEEKPLTRGEVTRKMCHDNIERLIEEDKPENGIEDDYKMKKNSVFMWQSRRLFCMNYLNHWSDKNMQSKNTFMEHILAWKEKQEQANKPPGNGAATVVEEPSGAGGDMSPTAGDEAAAAPPEAQAPENGAKGQAAADASAPAAEGASAPEAAQPPQSAAASEAVKATSEPPAVSASPDEPAAKKPKLQAADDVKPQQAAAGGEAAAPDAAKAASESPAAGANADEPAAKKPKLQES